MRPVRLIRPAVFSAALVLGLGGGAGLAAAQTAPSTTMPPVRSIPVTPAPTTPTTAAPATNTAAATTTETAAAATQAPLADTGIAADRLVPLGFGLIGLGAALSGASRRTRRAYTLL